MHEENNRLFISPTETFFFATTGREKTCLVTNKEKENAFLSNNVFEIQKSCHLLLFC